MIRSNFGAVRLPLLGAAVLASFAVSLSAQVVERGRTYADLVSSHPCNSGNSGRLARVTDAQSSSSIGGGGGSTQVWAVCNGVDTWTLTSVGGGGVSGLTSCADGTALADNSILRGDGTTKCQGSAITVADTTGNLQWEGTTADDFEGNFTFADPTADWTWAWGADGALTGATQFNLENLRLDGNTISTTNVNGDLSLTPNGTGQVIVPHGAVATPGISVPGNNATGVHIVSGGTESFNYVINGVPVLFSSAARLRLPGAAQFGWIAATDTNANEIDTVLQRSAAGIVKLTNTLNLVPIASPPRTCDATAEGDIYSDTSHALCFCDGTTWNVLTGSGAGSCA